MKSISVFIMDNKKVVCGSECCKQCSTGTITFDLFQYATDVICEEYNLINYVFEFGSAYINKSFIKRILQYEKSIFVRKDVKFINTVRFVDCIPQKNEVKFLKKHKVSLEILFSDIHCLELSFRNCKQKSEKYDSISILNYSGDDIIQIYNFSKQYCKTIKLKQVNLSSFLKSKAETSDLIDNLKKMYDIWVVDKNGIDLKPISDYVRNNFGVCATKECVNSSCLGKALAIDSEGVLYMCPYQINDKFVLGNIKNISRISEVFNCQNFQSIVSTMIEKRKKCLNNCSIFNYCQSGCCTDVVCQTFSDYNCELLKELDSYICNHIQRIIHNYEDLTIYNPVLVNIIRDVICYNPVALSTRTK